MNKPIQCCFISTSGKPCQSPAQFEIIFHCHAPNPYTQSCPLHIGELIDDSIDSFTVLRITQAKLSTFKKKEKP